MVPIILSVVAVIAVAWTLAYHRAGALPWAIALAAGAAALTWGAQAPFAVNAAAWVIAGGFALVAVVRPVRRTFVSAPLFGLFRSVLPAMSDTEREALEAGSVWWDADLFSGRPDWDKLLAYPAAKLTAEEKAFVDGPTEELCGLLDEWEISDERMDLPPAVWKFIRDKGFLGIIIPKRYGGLGFSAFAHSEIVTKIATRSGAAAVTVMVPNSLGPAELLIHYGTEAQKDHYLPRLAQGLEIPCFALTNPEAGSDAASIPDFGIVCKGVHEGKEVLGIRLTWEKRYITLAPVATILGLAFKLHDPEKLLGGEEDRGITLALIPTTHPGVNTGRRHNPLGSAFMNGPTTGKDVFIPIDWVIGGAAQAGNGWRMLMECLAAGRSISLPSMSMAAGKVGSRASGAYARIRSQFKTPIGHFEGIQEPLARIGGSTYLMDGMRRMTMAALDLGEKPSVISAICKYHMTERMRSVVNDAMDIHGGKGICLGPNNYLGRAYQTVPIAITVEGANILTRSLIVFGQGAIRCHPWVLKEMMAVRNDSLREFDEAFWGHVGFTISNAARALWLGLTGGKGLSVPGSPHTRRYLQILTRFSSAFALLADLSMFVIGGSLKRKEMLSARLGDILSYLYMMSATVKRFHDDGCPEEDVPLLTWAMYDSCFRLQVAMDGVLANFPSRPVAWAMRLLAFPKGLTLTAPHDKWASRVAKLMIEPGPARDRLSAGMYLPRKEDDPIGRLEFAMEAVIASDPVEARLRAAQKAGQLPQRTVAERREAAVKLGVITAEESTQLARTDRLRRAVIMVDDFPNDLSRQTRQEDAPWPRAASM
jgi:acyl-CoA dehydrogenase